MNGIQGGLNLSFSLPVFLKNCVPLIEKNLRKKIDLILNSYYKYSLKDPIGKIAIFPPHILIRKKNKQFSQVHNPEKWSWKYCFSILSQS